jgi:hypothetical protein
MGTADCFVRPTISTVMFVMIKKRRVRYFVGAKARVTAAKPSPVCINVTVLRYFNVSLGVNKKRSDYIYVDG